MLTIHHLQRSQSERILWLCEELGIEYNLRIYQRDPFFSPPELHTLTPLGAAPVITDDAFNPSNPLILAESGAIVEYIIHKHGSGRLCLLPAHKDYADYLYWFHLSNSNLQPCLLRCTTFRPLKLSPDHPVQKGNDMRLEKLLNVIDQRLRKVPWLAGEEFTAADVMTVFSLSTMRMFYRVNLTAYEGIVAWLKRVGQRPAYQAAMAKGDPGLEPCLMAGPPTPFPGMGGW